MPSIMYIFLREPQKFECLHFSIFIKHLLCPVPVGGHNALMAIVSPSVCLSVTCLTLSWELKG